MLENSFYGNRNNEFLRKITKFFFMFFSEIQMMKDVDEKKLANFELLRFQ